jgi:hypothetical protein
MNPNIGRFHTMDSYEGNREDPPSLHKYTFCSNNGMNSSDPTGNFSLGEISISEAVIATLFTNVATTLAGGAFAISNGATPSAIALTWSTKDIPLGGALTLNGSFTVSYDLSNKKISFALSGNAGLNPFSLLSKAQKGSGVSPEIDVIFGDQNSGRNVSSVTAYWPINSTLLSLGLKAFGKNAQGINSILGKLSKGGMTGSSYGSSIGIGVSSDGSDTLAFPPGPTFGTVYSQTRLFPQFDINAGQDLSEFNNRLSSCFGSLSPSSFMISPAQLFAGLP